jgi:hypothetical protein
MSRQKQFNRELDRLYKRRTGWLRTVLTKANPGPVPTLNKKTRERAIKSLQSIASTALAKKLAKREFQRAIEKRKTWMTKGRGEDEKRRLFKAWARKQIDSSSGKVYVFWRRKQCRYVGRTRGRGTRPSHHFKKSWFRKATRIDVYMAPRKSDISRLECLASHRFLPSRNKIKVAKERGTPRCPLCGLHKKIKNEIRRIYRFR